VTIPDNFVLEFEDDNAEVYNMILENPDAITWRATGTSQVESSLTFLERPVDNEV
jgi:hypothetical protein